MFWKVLREPQGKCSALELLYLKILIPGPSLRGEGWEASKEREPCGGAGWQGLCPEGHSPDREGGGIHTGLSLSASDPPLVTPVVKPNQKLET